MWTHVRVVMSNISQISRLTCKLFVRYYVIDKILSLINIQNFRNKGLSVAYMYVYVEHDEDEQMKIGAVGSNYQLFLLLNHFLHGNGEKS